MKESRSLDLVVVHRAPLPDGEVDGGEEYDDRGRRGERELEFPSQRLFNEIVAQSI